MIRPMIRAFQARIIRDMATISAGRAHELFRRFPLTARHPTRAGEFPSPYHVYDGHAVWIGGTADLAAVRALLRPERVAPATTRSGRALAGVWAVDETDASLGPHTELQFSIYVAPEPPEPVADGPFAALAFLLRDPAARQLCHGLWNNTAEVVAFNREVLGLTPRLGTSRFEASPGRMGFEFTDAETGRAVARGNVRAHARPPMAAMAGLTRSLGLALTLRAAGLKVIETTVVNPVSPALGRNADAQTFAASASIVAQLFDPADDRLEVLDPTYAALDFRPTFIEHLRGFKMVYLNPT